MLSTEVEEFSTKKAAMDAGMRSRVRWFAKFFVPFVGESPTVVKGEEFFAEDQVEEVFSISKGTREIGPLRPGSKPVGKKKFRSVSYVVYRQSDFIFQPKVIVERNVKPARSIDLLDAVAKIKATAAKFEKASAAAKARKDHKRSRGFKKRMNNLLELSERGVRRAINEERIVVVKKRGKTHHYVGEGHDFESKVPPPNWMVKEKPSNYQVNPPKPLRQSQCRLMDAVYTIELLEDDPTLDW